jgi:hypothetical protein
MFRREREDREEGEMMFVGVGGLSCCTVNTTVGTLIWALFTERNEPRPSFHPGTLQCSACPTL